MNEWNGRFYGEIVKIPNVGQSQFFPFLSSRRPPVYMEAVEFI